MKLLTPKRLVEEVGRTDAFEKLFAVELPFADCKCEVTKRVRATARNRLSAFIMLWIQLSIKSVNCVPERDLRMHTANCRMSNLQPTDKVISEVVYCGWSAPTNIKA